MTLEAGCHLDDPGSILASSPAGQGERAGGSRRQLVAQTFTLVVSWSRVELSSPSGRLRVAARMEQSVPGDMARKER